MEKEFKLLLEKFLEDIDAIDNKTPWQDSGPEWWLQMMTIRKEAQQYLWCLDFLTE